MSEQSFTAAVLLGASSFPLHSETYAPNEAFFRSKQDFRAYLQDPQAGLALADDSICDLFDLPQLPSQQLVSIGKFLEKVGKRIDRGAACNLIVYYVGHGYFAGPRQEYHVALACLEDGYDATTGLKINELAEVLKERARSFRRFVILDCCFAAEALKEFQGAAQDAIYAKARGAFAEDVPCRPQAVPRRGTALYCAAGKDHVARSPKELPRTMFSDALLAVLRQGDPQCAPYMTLAQVRDLAWERLQGYANPVRPVLHSPDQTEGDIAAIVGLFPNRRHPAAEPITPPDEKSERLPAPRLLEANAIPQGLDEGLVELAARELTRLVGPIAPILIRRVRQQSGSFDDFCRLIAQRLEPGERQQFLVAIAKINGGCRKNHGADKGAG